ncbi:hypothetical protein LCGC14_3051670, partial [marine sediment metagenome]
FRPDLIKRAVLSEQSKKRNPQGRFLLAGKQVTASSVGPGSGISKVPRTHGKGTHHGNRAALIHSTVGGRLAHPPKVEKIIVEKINKKEHRLALWSAVSATASRDTVESRGHLFDEKISFPIIVEDKINNLERTKEVIEAIEKLGVGDDLSRSQIKKIRAGKIIAQNNPWVHFLKEYIKKNGSVKGKGNTLKMASIEYNKMKKKKNNIIV